MRKTYPFLQFTLVFIIVTIISIVAVLMINGRADNTLTKTSYASDSLVKSSDVKQPLTKETLLGNWQSVVGDTTYTYEIKDKVVTTYINGEKYGKPVEYIYDSETGSVNPKDEKDLFPLCDSLVLNYKEASFKYMKLTLDEYSEADTPVEFYKISTFSLP